MLLSSADGTILSSFGSEIGFKSPHGVFVDQSDDAIWVTDCGLHQVFKFARDGTLLLTLGAAVDSDADSISQADSDNSDVSRFNKPADVSLDPTTGTIFVADGYGNSRVVAFDSSGRFLRQFGGQFGDGEGQINVAHNCAFAEGKLIVCDRDNSRFHVYDAQTTERLATWPHAADVSGPTEDRAGFTWAVRWDPATRLLYSLEGRNCVVRTLHGAVVGKWDVDQSHDLLVSTREGRTTVYIGEMQQDHGKLACFCCVGGDGSSRRVNITKL